MFKRIILLTLFTFLLSGCKSTHRVHISKDEYLKNYNSVVLTGFQLPDVLDNRQDVVKFYEDKVTQLFERQGIKVFPKVVYIEEFEKQKLSAGGYIDKFTGKVDRTKRQAIEDATLEALAKEKNIDSALFYDIRIKKAHFGDYRAQWDGQEEPYEKNNNDLTNFLSTIVVKTSGYIPALSMLVFLQDMDNQELYMGAGGIELIAKLNDDNEFDYLPTSSLLQSKEKMVFSVNEAFRKIFNESR